MKILGSYSNPAEKVYKNKNNSRHYWQVFGEFVGYDGYEYVALKKLGMFTDKTVLRKSNFDRMYQEVELESRE